ncbi:MAG: hypothetical protein J6U54_17015 [Clostridiales bacterium]|nr:hypothetical protein [Clostridiales bacterium]
MRERRYSSEEVVNQAKRIVESLKENAQEWRKLPYRYICLFCGVPLRSAQPILVRVRAHPNVEYRYQPSSVRIPTAICHYVEEENNSIRSERFAQFDETTYRYLYEKVSLRYNPNQNHEKFMLLMIFIEQLLLNGFHTMWRDLAYGAYAIMMGVEISDIQRMVSDLEKTKIIKRLGMGRLYRIALSEREFKSLEESAYAKQQEEIVERSKNVLKSKPAEQSENEFTVLTELNAVTSIMKDTLESSYVINERVVKQQMLMNDLATALQSLQEKESVYSGMAVRINAISKNYEQAIENAKELEAKNTEMKHLAAQHDKFYKEQKNIAKENLEAMFSRILSSMEEYFTLPLREKNNLVNINRTKTAVTKIVMSTIEAIEKGKLVE